MRVIAVLDLMQGLVVRGVGGKRSEYRPIRSPLVRDPEPLRVAEAFYRRLGIDEFYLADLDAIRGASPATHVYEQLLRSGFVLWIDAGLRNVAQARHLADLRMQPCDPPVATETFGDQPSNFHTAADSASEAAPHGAPAGCRRIARVIAGLETLPDLATLRHMLAAIGSDRLVLSLDMRDGRPMLSPQWMGPPNIEQIAREAYHLGVRRFIVLDVSRVGRREGPSTAELCRRVRDLGDVAEVVAGGGVRHAGDLGPLADAGCDAVLVATALHEGRITRADLQRLD